MPVQLLPAMSLAIQERLLFTVFVLNGQQNRLRRCAERISFGASGNERDKPGFVWYPVRLKSHLQSHLQLHHSRSYRGLVVW